jgi:predicted permease
MAAPLKQMTARIRAFFRRGVLDRDFDQELESHLTMLAEENSRRGMMRPEALRAARLELGGLAQLREAHREARGLPLLDAFLLDVRYALRTLGRSPGFTAVAVLTLAIGIGVNTAIFSAYNAVALRPLQATEPHRLVQVIRSNRDQFFSYPDYAYYRDHNRTFSGLTAMGLGSTLFLGGVDKQALVAHSTLADAAGFRLPRSLAGSVEQAGAGGVSGNYFQTLGAGAALGCTFLPEEDAAGAQPVALISYNFWERRFARDPGLLGRSLMLNGASVTIVGITPRDFTGTAPAVPDLWLPLALQSRLTSKVDTSHDRNSICCRVFGRLRPGVAREQAEAEMNALSAQLELAFPRPDSRPGSQTARFVVTQASPNGPPDSGATALAMVILASVSLVLLIACANVASLLLARSAARQREIAIRLAIGASRGRLVRQLITENAVMSLMAGCLGIVFSWWSLRFLLMQVVASLPSYWTIALHVAPDQRVLAYTLFLSLSATVVCGLAPALEASRPNLTSALKDEGAAFGGHLRKSRLRDLMVGGQVAVCLVLLIAAGLLARTSQRALEVDLGFNYRNIVMLHIGFPPAARAVPAKVAAIRTQLARQLERLPEIQSMAVASRLPLGGGVRTIAVSLNGGALNDTGAQNAFFNMVTPGYFDTMSIRLLQGRNFTAQEARDGFSFDDSPVIVSEATARRFWPGEDPVGKRFAFGPGRHSSRFAGEEYPHSVSSVVIGVAKDVRSLSLIGMDDTCLYFPATGARSGAIVMRARGDEGRAVAAVQREFQAIGGDLAAEVMDSRAAFSNQAGFVVSRVGAIGSAIIGILGLLMATVGIHGTVRFAVTQRTQEIGIRMALGAERGDVLRLVLYETMRPVAFGLAAGLVGAAVVSRLMSSFLFGLSVLDPVAFLGVPCFFAAVTLVAGCVPARRATRVDPMIALRYE